jgi:serine/threonine protein kinase
MSDAAASPDGHAEPTVVLPPPLKPGHTLPAGTRIHDYRIDRVLGEGGFGIVYLATDVVLERQVAIKEYLPSSMAARAGQSLTVLVKSAEYEETFQIGLRSFVNEAKLLARFDHPALLKVHQFWEENGTAYMAMPYYQGPTLKLSLARLGRQPTEREVRAWLMPLLDALEVLHAAHCYHRDIAPDNILLTDHGPLLLDFGAARRVIGEQTHALTAMLKPGFAPIEQYGDMPGVTQGPWTDIFALASVLYAAISGRRTVASVERLLDDRLQPLATVAAGRCGNAFLAAIDRALAVHPKDRPQSIAEFRALLTADDTQALELDELRALGVPSGDETVLLPDIDLAGTAPTEHLPTATQPAPTPQPEPMATVLSPPALAPTTAPAPAQVTSAPPAARVAPPPPTLPVPASAASRRPLLLGLGALAALAAAWGGYRLSAAPAPADTPAASAVAASSAPAPEPAASRVEPASPAPSSAAPAASALPVTAAASPSPVLAASAPAPVASAPPPSSKQRTAAAPVAPRGARCSDILQKASLEPLTPSEAAYLRKECR